MSKEDDYDDYSDEDDGDDIHAECLACGTLNRFPGKDIPKILCYECGEIIVANHEAPAPSPSPAAPATSTSSTSSSPLSSSSPSSPSSPSSSAFTSSPSYPPVSGSMSPKEKGKKKSIFSLGKSKEKKPKSKAALGPPAGVGGGVGGNPSITAPVFVKHVSGATQADNLEETENGLMSGNRPDPSLPVDVERKSKAMDIPIGVEQKPLTGGMETVSAPTNVRKNPDPLSSIQQGGKPKKLNKEERKQAKEKEKEEKRMKKVYEREARKSAKSGVVLEKRKFPNATSGPASPASPGSTSPTSPGTGSSASPAPSPSPPSENAPEEEEEEDVDEDEVSEFCSNCGSLNVFPPGADRVACYECDTPIVAPTSSARNNNGGNFQGGGNDQDSYEDDDDDEITDVCPACGTLNAFPSETVPQIACYNCASPINNPKMPDAGGGGPAGAGAAGAPEEEGELQAFCSKCGSLNIFPPGVFAVACWECENPIYYNT